MSLLDIWRDWRGQPAWLSTLAEIGVSRKALDALEDLAEPRVWWRRPFRRPQPTTMLPRPEVDPAWARERRKEYLRRQIVELKWKLVDSRIDLARERSATIRVMILHDIERLGAAIKRHQSELDGIDRWRSDANVGKVPQETVDRARRYSLKTLLGTDNNMVSCPLHGEDRKPSMSIKYETVGHCFTCGENIDAIGWLMAQGMDFVSAVRRLSQ